MGKTTGAEQQILKMRVHTTCTCSSSNATTVPIIQFMRTSVWTSLALVSPGILYGIMPANVMMDLAISLSVRSIDAAVNLKLGSRFY